MSSLTTGSASAQDYEPLSSTAQASLLCACGAFALQAALHWIRASSISANARSQQHEQLSGAATSCCAMIYLTMACQVLQGLYTAANSDSHQLRIYFGLGFAARGIVGGILLVNVCALARERRPPMVAMVGVWTTMISALFFGYLAKPGGGRRSALLAAAVALHLPLISTLVCSMGSRLRESQLQVVYRFLASWLILCGMCYCIIFYCCPVAGLLSTETEILVYTLLDYCLVGVSCLVVTCASGQDLEAPLLPAQEAELSLYPGPHNHGFFPNLHYYDDNL